MTNAQLAYSLVEFSARDLLDVDDRPVAEVASPLYPNVPTELARCPYPDTRLGGSMNRSALRQMTTCWPDVLDAFGALAGPEPTVHRAWAVAVTGISLPLLVPQPTSRLVASFFKASLGLSQIFGSMLLSDEAVADTPLTALGDGDAFFAALDQGRWLIGADQVCAGTPAMFVAVFNAMVSQKITPHPDELSESVQRAGQIPTTAVGLHAAYLLACQQAAREGEGAPITEGIHPWLRAIFAAPNRPVQEVLQLYGSNNVPPAVGRFVALRHPNRAALKDSFEAELLGLNAE